MKKVPLRRFIIGFGVFLLFYSIPGFLFTIYKFYVLNILHSHLYVFSSSSLYDTFRYWYSIAELGLPILAGIIVSLLFPKKLTIATFYILTLFVLLQFIKLIFYARNYIFDYPYLSLKIGFEAVFIGAVYGAMLLGGIVLVQIYRYLHKNMK